MATYSDLFARRQSGGDLLNRFVIALDAAASAVLTEDAGTDNHAARLAWAYKALFDPAKSQSYASTCFRYALVTNSTVQDAPDTITDDEILAFVGTALPALVASGL